MFYPWACAVMTARAKNAMKIAAAMMPKMSAGVRDAARGLLKASADSLLRLL